jgi:hypothetical protein
MANRQEGHRERAQLDIKSEKKGRRDNRMGIESVNEGISAASFWHQLVSISPTFYEQLLRQNPFAKKLQTQIVST